MTARAVACVIFTCSLLLAGCGPNAAPPAPKERGPDLAGVAARLMAQPLPAAQGKEAVPERPPRAETLRRFWSGDFTWLEARLGEQQAGLADPALRERAADHLNRMLRWLSSEPQAFQIAERWRSAQPKSYWAHAVLGNAYMEEAWRARGSAFAAETTAQQFAGLERWRKRAIETLIEALALDARPVSAIDGLLWSTLGHASHAERRALADAALRIVPESRSTYLRLLEGLTPKWGGGLEGMRELIERARRSGAPEAIVREMEADTFLAETEDARRLNQRLRPDHYGKAAEMSNRSGNWRWYGWALQDAVRLDEAERAFTRAVELDADNLDALNARGNLLRQGGKVEAGFADIRKAAEAGHYKAQETLIRAYAYGNEGLKQDLDALRPWCEVAASHGNSWGEFCIGGMYFDGLSGYPRDRARAVDYFRRAAEKGHSVAQHDYGWMLVRGDSVAADKPTGIRWLRAAARQGSDQAKDKLRGLGVAIEEEAPAATGLMDLLKRLLG